MTLKRRCANCGRPKGAKAHARGCQSARRRKSSTAAHRKRVEAQYSLPKGDYDRLYEEQGGKCPICLRATGLRKRLAVDHDHACCPGPTSCGLCVRGLLCSTCNRTLAHARDEIEFFERCIEYLQHPPYERIK